MADTTTDPPNWRRVPWTALLISTTIAVAAALAVVVFVGDDSTGGADRTTDSLDVTPRGVDGNVAELAVFGFDGTTSTFGETVGGGTPTIVNFFASTCTPCVREMPVLEAVHQQLGDKVRFVGLARLDQPEDALRTVKDTGVTYDVARDPDGAIMAALGGVVMPTTAFVDADGNVVLVHSGELETAEVLRIIADEFGITA